MRLGGGEKDGTDHPKNRVCSITVDDHRLQYDIVIRLSGNRTQFATLFFYEPHQSPRTKEEKRA